MKDTKSLSNKKQSRTVLGFVSEYYLVITLIALVIAGCILSPKFLNTNNILNVLLQNSMTTIVAIGMLFVIITGGIDLSVGSVIALSGCLVSGFLQESMPTLLAILIVLLFMGIAGVISGILVSKGQVAPFIATLAMMTILRGLAYMYQIGADRRIDGTDLTEVINSNLGFIPIPVIIMAVVILIAWFLLKNTTFGRSVYAVGGNAETARLAGINITLVLIGVYILSSVFAGISGIILTGRLSLGTAIVGNGAEMDAIAAVVVGGASLKGGKGTVMNTVIGAFIIGVLVNIMNLMQIAAYPQMIIKGIIILVAVMSRKSK